MASRALSPTGQGQRGCYPKSVAGSEITRTLFRPRGAACKGSRTHPCDLLGGTFQQTAVDGLNLRLQLRRHLLSSSSPRALSPLSSLPGPQLRLCSRSRDRRPCPGAVRAAASRVARGAKRDANLQQGRRLPARAPGLGAQKSSRRLARDPGKDTENPGPGTPAGHYRVQRQERGKNTQAGVQSILGIVVAPCAAKE